MTIGKVQGNALYPQTQDQEESRGSIQFIGFTGPVRIAGLFTSNINGLTLISILSNSMVLGELMSQYVPKCKLSHSFSLLFTGQAANTSALNRISQSSIQFHLNSDRKCSAAWSQIRVDQFSC